MYIYLPIAEQPIHALVVLGIGWLIGVIMGMVGIGGGFLLTPLMIFFGIPSPVAVASVANQIVAPSVSGVLSHWKSGNVDIKTGSLVISTAGQGINFQATSSITGMESESLDDYEEGSYTCVLTGSGGGSHNITGCSYVKVGKQVTCQITLANPGSNSVSGYWSFTLPFQAVQTSGFAYFGGYVTYTRHLPGYTEGNGNFSHIALHTYHGQSSAVLYKLRNGSGEANTLQGSLNTQAILAFTMVYNAVT